MCFCAHVRIFVHALFCVCLCVVVEGGRGRGVSVCLLVCLLAWLLTCDLTHLALICACGFSTRWNEVRAPLRSLQLSGNSVQWAWSLGSWLIRFGPSRTCLFNIPYLYIYIYIMLILRVRMRVCCDGLFSGQSTLSLGFSRHKRHQHQPLLRDCDSYS